jgi:acylpyruvate hydrolase
MRLLTFEEGARARLGILVDGRVVDLNASCAKLLSLQGVEAGAISDLPSEMRAFLEAGDSAMAAARRVEGWASRSRDAVSYSLQEVRLRAPIQNPNRMIFIGRNYRVHAEDVGLDIPQELCQACGFTKFPDTCIIGPEDPIVRPKLVKLLDWEGELAVVIGREGKYIPLESALDHVAGYMPANDLTAREFPIEQLFLQKNWDGSLPIGPYLVTADEVPDPQDLRLRLDVNGRVFQEASTSDMTFGVAYIIHYVSQTITLQPGDVICTGTPGSGMSVDPPVFLQPGDRVTLEIEGLGTLSNPVVDEGS